MKTRAIRQTVVVSAPAIEIYNAFMNQKQHAAFTGMKAKINPVTGGYFSTCGNRNLGYNLHLEKENESSKHGDSRLSQTSNIPSLIFAWNHCRRQLASCTLFN